VKQFESRGPSRERRNWPAKPATTAALLAQKDVKNNFAYCLKNHASEDCKEVRDVKGRKTLIFRYARCFRCLNKGHRAKDCISDVKCKTCGGDHHISLCEGKNESGSGAVAGSGKENVNATHVAIEGESVSEEKIESPNAIRLYHTSAILKIRHSF